MGSLLETEIHETSFPCQTSLVGRAEPFACRALDLAVNYSLERIEPDGHWYGELKYGPI